MSLGVDIKSINREYFNSNYRFSFTDGRAVKSIEESIYDPTDSEEDLYGNSTLEQLNESLLEVEKIKGKSAIIVAFDGLPEEIKEIFSNVAGGKYQNFLSEVDGFVLGRNFEQKTKNVFIENQGTTSSSELSKELTNGRADNLIYIDTYNKKFNSIGTEKEGDKLFTKFSQTLAMVANIVKQAYFIENDYIKEDEKVYAFMKDFFVDIKKHVVDKGYFLSVAYKGKSVFDLAVDSMIKNLEKYITESKSTGDVRVYFNMMV